MTLTVGPYPFFCEPAIDILQNGKISGYSVQLVDFKHHPSYLHSGQASIVASNSPKDCGTLTKNTSYVLPLSQIEPRQ